MKITTQGAEDIMAAAARRPSLCDVQASVKTLKARHGKLVAMLKRLHRSEMDVEEGECPLCHMLGACSDDCELAALLAEVSQ